MIGFSPQQVMPGKWQSACDILCVREGHADSQAVDSDVIMTHPLTRCIGFRNGHQPCFSRQGVEDAVYDSLIIISVMFLFARKSLLFPAEISRV